LEVAREIAPFMEEYKLQHVYEEFPVGQSVPPQKFFSFKAWLEKRI
jgi:phospholipase/carboxylesterase